MWDRRVHFGIIIYELTIGKFFVTAKAYEGQPAHWMVGAQPDGNIDTVTVLDEGTAGDISNAKMYAMQSLKDILSGVVAELDTELNKGRD